MKHLLPPAIALLFFIDSFGQPSINLDKTYIIGQNASLYQCTPMGVRTGDSQTVYRNYEFNIDRVKDSELVIHFLRWSKVPSNNRRLFSTISDAKTPNIYFLLRLKEFRTAVERTSKAAFAVGIAVIPIKMRFGNNDLVDPSDRRYFNFESSVSLGFSVGFSKRLDKSKFTARNNISFLTGLSLSSVPLDSFTTKGFIKTSSNNASITWHVGILYQIDNFQIGCFSGVDFLAGEIGKQWKYMDKPWVGVGLGYSIFQAKKTTDKQ